MSVIMILLVAVSTAQISSLVIINDDLGNNVYAIPLIGERQYRTQADGTDSTPMNSQISNPGFEIAQAPSSAQGPPHSPPGPPFAKQVLQVRQVIGPETIIETPETHGMTVTAECDSDEFVTGGGYVSSTDRLAPTSEQATPSGWEVRLFVNEVHPGDSAHAVAECAKLVDAP